MVHQRPLSSPPCPSLRTEKPAWGYRQGCEGLPGPAGSKGKLLGFAHHYVAKPCLSSLLRPPQELLLGNSCSCRHLTQLLLPACDPGTGYPGHAVGRICVLSGLSLGPGLCCGLPVAAARSSQGRLLGAWQKMLMWRFLHIVGSDEGALSPSVPERLQRG